VVLLERWPSVGGMATSALVNIWHTSDRVKPVIRGFVQEAIERSGRFIHPLPGFPTRPETHEFDPAGMQVVFQRMLDECGVRTICNLAAVESIVEGGRLRAVLVDTRQGRRAVIGKLFIDATGDGDIAANAGLPVEFGRSSDGGVQGMTMMFRLSGVYIARVNAHPAKADEVYRLMCEGRQRGDFPPFFDFAAHSYLHEGRDSWVSYNMCPVAGNPLDEAELTRMTARAREQVYRYVELWQARMPGYEHAIVEQIGFALGVRESRRIRGVKTLDGTMVVDAVKQSDAVGHGFWCIDIHDPKGEGYTTWTERSQARMAPPVGESYHIPLGMCLNHTIPNLAVVGRCASTTHEGLSSVRLQTHCMVMGQGAGTAAAMALASGVEMSAVDVSRLQAQLRADGVYLEDVP
jgi:hypothetical protein